MPYSNRIDLNDCRSYATEANLVKAIKNFGLDQYVQEEGQAAMRYIVACTPTGRWTAIFLVSAFFAMNNTGGYICLASQHGFMSI